jgi:hypothetical protein
MLRRISNQRPTGDPAQSASRSGSATQASLFGAQNCQKSSTKT